VAAVAAKFAEFARAAPLSSKLLPSGRAIGNSCNPHDALAAVIVAESSEFIAASW